MKILYLEHYAGSDRYGMEFRPYYMAREWVKNGHDVTIVAADYSHLRRENPVVSHDFEEEFSEGVRFVWVKTPSYQGNGVGRVRNIMTFLRKTKAHAAALAAAYQPDVVINSSTYPMDVHPAEKIARAAGARLCYEIHDLWPLSLMEIGHLSEKNPLIRYVQRAEDYCYTHCDGVVSILPAAEKHIRERGHMKIPVYHVPNGVVLHDGRPESEPLGKEHADALQALHDQNRFIVLYAGGHARSNALDFFVNSAEKIPDGSVLVLVGKGEQKERLMQECRSQIEKGKIVFLPPVPKKQIPTLLEKADCLYNGALRSRLCQYGVGMNKNFDYMLSGRPVINAVEAAGDPIDLSGCGMSIPAEDSGEIAAAVSRMMAMTPAERDEMGERGRQYVVKNHEYSVLAARFIEALQAL